MVAVDLPGYGGSDSLHAYNPDNMLEAITEFVLQMRDKYIPSEEGKPRSTSRVVLVAHDWGALIGFRLASEAPQLADRFVLSNSFHVSNFLWKDLNIS
jgi:pimeloyl-ACP methyl ester carboxylesterase